MGWKISAIIIHPAPETDALPLLRDLGFPELYKIEDEPFEVAMNPDDNKIYLGTCKNNLLICAQTIPLMFLDEGLSDAEQFLTAKFPQAEICSVVLHSVVNLWGYAVVKNGRKVRARAGSSDDGTFLETGEPLEEEKELLQQSTINEQGSRIYRLHDNPQDALSEDQVGENFVFEICKRYFGVPLNEDDELLFETTLSGYSYSVQGARPRDAAPEPVKAAKPWYKFW
jgi:hypothetical protein